MEFVAFGISFGSLNLTNGFAASVCFDTNIFTFMSVMCLEAFTNLL